MIRNKRIVAVIVVAPLAIAVRMVNAPASFSQGGAKKPNILVILAMTSGPGHVQGIHASAKDGQLQSGPGSAKPDIHSGRIRKLTGARLSEVRHAVM